MSLKVVFDTNVLISATLWDNSVAQKLLFQLIEKEVPIYSSLEILEEYQKVLKRDFGYSNQEIIEIVENVLQFVSLVIPQDKIKVVKEDPEDNKILECAIESSSNYIFTYDKHLLKLKEYKNIKIIKPEEFLVKL